MTEDALPKPGPQVGLSGRPLHFFFLADCSGSMDQNGKIQALNEAIRQAAPHMRKAAEDNPQAQVLVRAIKFSTGAQWHLAQPTQVDQFAWTDVAAGGPTDLGQALKMLAEELKTPPMARRALPPVIVLLTDGEPTDDWGSGLKALLEQPWGQKSVRIAIAIGGDANRDVLKKFMGALGNEVGPLEATSPEALIKHIRWASTQVLNSVASPTAASAAALADAPAADRPAVTIEPPPPAAEPGATVPDVW